MDVNAGVDRKARRYQQIAELERKLTLQQKAIRDAKAHVKDLKSEADATFLEIRAAARDEGELPLLDVMDDAISKKAS